MLKSLPMAVESTHYQPPQLVTFSNFNFVNLTQDNYPIWLPQIIPHLRGGNIFGLMDLSCVHYPPLPLWRTKSPPPSWVQYVCTRRCKIRSSLALSPPPFRKKMLSHAARCTTSKQAYTKLKTLCISIQSSYPTSALLVGHFEERQPLHRWLFSQVSDSHRCLCSRQSNS